MNEYVEVYALDDWAGEPVPFYGLQDVLRIALPLVSTEEEVLNICRERCRSDHFVLIDAYKVLPKSFLLEVAMCASRGLDSAHGYRIFTKHTQEASLAAEINSMPP